jgi:hypothetical protein
MEEIDQIIANPKTATDAAARSPAPTSLTAMPLSPDGLMDGERFSWAKSLRGLLGGSRPAAGGAAAAAAGTAERLLLTSGAMVPDISGGWRQTRESQARMEEMRQKSGSGWVTSKLFEFMESKFTIQQDGLQLECRLWPMPALKFVLDGEEHPWGIRLPLFTPSWTYRAWIDASSIVLQHEIENRRLTRYYWCNDERTTLFSRAKLEVQEAGVYRQVSVVEQEAARVF